MTNLLKSVKRQRSFVFRMFSHLLPVIEAWRVAQLFNVYRTSLPAQLIVNIFFFNESEFVAIDGNILSQVMFPVPAKPHKRRELTLTTIQNIGAYF